MKKLLAVLVISVCLGGCSSDCPKPTQKDPLSFYYSVEQITKQISDSLQRDNIAMDNLGHENLSEQQVDVYNANLQITLALLSVKRIALEMSSTKQSIYFK